MKRDLIEKFLLIWLPGFIALVEVFLINKVKFGLEFNVARLHTTTITIIAALLTALAVLGNVGIFWYFQKEKPKQLNTKSFMATILMGILMGIWFSGIFFLLNK